MIYKMNGADKIASVALGGGVNDLIDEKVKAALDARFEEYEKQRLPRIVWYSADGHTPEFLDNGLYAFHFSAREHAAAGNVGVITWDVFETQLLSYTWVTNAWQGVPGAQPKYATGRVTSNFTQDAIRGAFGLDASYGSEALVDGIINKFGSWISVKWSSGTCWTGGGLSNGYVKVQIDNSKTNHKSNALSAGRLRVWDGDFYDNVFELTVWKLTDHVSW